MTSRAIPPLLQPFLSPPSPGDKKLMLVTGVLGASANWLVLRYLASCLLQSQPSPTTSNSNPVAFSNIEAIGTSQGGGSNSSASTVVLVSFLRDRTFWTSSASKLGLDLAAAGRKGRFVFVDGMGVFAPPTTKPRSDPGWHVGLGCVEGKGIESVGMAVLQVISRVKAEMAEGGLTKGSGNGSVVLVVDGLDFLQAAMEESSSFIEDIVMSWRQATDSLAMTLHSDDPLLHTKTTSLEKHHASLLLNSAHSANIVFACRMLDTGGASDVSGVIRITSGGGNDWDSQDVEEAEERELLYFASSDGSVKVFERGS